MIRDLTLKVGAHDHHQELSVPTEGITVFVGPNNSGKSLLLRELEQALTGGVATETKLLGSLHLAWEEVEALASEFSQIETEPPQGQSRPENHRYVLRTLPNGSTQHEWVDYLQLENAIASYNEQQIIRGGYLRYFLIRLDGRTRFGLTSAAPMGDLLGPPASMLAKLFRDEKARNQVREIIFSAFSRYFVIDPTAAPQLRIRLSDKSPPNTFTEQGLDEVARSFHSQAPLIQELSDGMQAFTGIVCAACSGNFKQLLIDEPEAFLHPPLARRLGYELARLTRGHAGRLFAATHSADFMMGCISSGAKVNIVRLGYKDGISSARMIPPAVVADFMKRPILKSTDVISSVFYEGVVITEADGDRVFYNEIFDRVTAGQPAAPMTLFTNAQTKQTIKDIMGPLRRLGVPALAIVDIDIIKDGGSVWTAWLQAAGIPEPSHSSLQSLRHTICTAFSTLHINMKRDGGVNALPAAEKRTALQLLDQLKQYGVFVVPVGELESWLSSLGVDKSKNGWVVRILEAMGGDPDGANYVHPGQGDVWDFMEEAIAWISDPSRQGMRDWGSS